MEIYNTGEKKKEVSSKWLPLVAANGFLTVKRNAEFGYVKKSGIGSLGQLCKKIALKKQTNFTK